MPVNRHQHAMLILAGIGIFIIGAFSGYGYRPYFIDITCKQKFEFINSTLACGGASHVISKGGFAGLREDVRAYIDAERDAGRVAEVSVYVRDLHNGPTLGIRDGADFSPASLLKTPLALYFMKVEEGNPGFLATSPPLQFAGEGSYQKKSAPESAKNLYQAFVPPEELQPNHPYPLEDLLFRMLAYSDNMAYVLLVDHAFKGLSGQEEVNQVFRDLGIITPDDIADESVTVRGYAGIFRQLYNSSYLNAELSEKILGWLSQSTFDAGLEAGVPEGVRVAHKFGERELSKPKTHQLHDCGIVYFPGNPYLICIMTKGKNVVELAPIIAHISELVYEEFESRRVE